MSSLVKTTIDELAALTDELELGGRIVFSTEDPEELKYYSLSPCQYNVIVKSKLVYEKDYVIVIGRIDGNTTIAKDISILSDGNIDDEDIRIDGITEFIEEYYNEYMDKNKYGNVYLIVD